MGRKDERKSQEEGKKGPSTSEDAGRTGAGGAAAGGAAGVEGEVGMDEDLDPEEAMQRMMGFGDFGTTKVSSFSPSSCCCQWCSCSWANFALQGHFWVTQYAIEVGWLDPSILDNPCKGTSRPQLRHWLLLLLLLFCCYIPCFSPTFLVPSLEIRLRF